MEIKIATRKSPLALYQAEAVKQAIIEKHPDCICELIPLNSEGDKDLRGRGLGAAVLLLDVSRMASTACPPPAHLSIHAFVASNDSGHS